MKPRTFIIGTVILALAGFAIHIGWNSQHYHPPHSTQGD
jgi:hypothetical protein